MSKPDERESPPYPELEPRRNRDAGYGEEAGRASRERARRPGDSTAFYMIEREAIQLRRMRWDPASKDAASKVDDLANRLSGSWDRAAPREQSRERQLAQYARPREGAREGRRRWFARMRRWFAGHPESPGPGRESDGEPGARQ